MTNEFVAMATKQCEVCGIIHSHNTEVLLSKTLRPIKEDQTFTGSGLCEEHDKLFKDGYTALVEIVEDGKESTTVRQEDAEE